MCESKSICFAMTCESLRNKPTIFTPNLAQSARWADNHGVGVGGGGPKEASVTGFSPLHSTKIFLCSWTGHLENLFYGGDISVPNPTGLGIFQDIKFCSDCLTDVAEMSKLLYLRFSINNFYTGSSFCRLPTASTA